MGGFATTYRANPAPASWSVFELAGAATLEAGLLFALLRPLSFQYHTGRGLAALIGLVITSTWWAAKAPLIAAPAYTVHLLWLMGLVAALCVLLGFSLWQQLMQRHR
jgi:hypothetical protein